MSLEKYFVDTSVLRPLVSSSKKVKDYYNSIFKQNIYYCSYVKMEFIRGFIIPAMNFYFTLRQPNITCVSDAISLWSNKFQVREVKAILSMFSGLLEGHKFDFNDLNDKDMAATRVAEYIRRILSISQTRFKDIGVDNNLCSKSSVNLNFIPDNIDDCFREFVTSFNNKDWTECNLHVFIIKNQLNIENVKNKKDIKIKDSNSKGFDEIISTLIINNELKCKECMKIGDLIISLISPKEMRLEHTDYSFDYLMTILEKKHFRHPSEIKILTL